MEMLIIITISFNVMIASYHEHHLVIAMIELC